MKRYWQNIGVRSSGRVGFLDEARGLCVLLMVLYHGAYDLVYLFGVNIPVFHWPILAWAQQFFAGMFILISGVSCRYSRSNLKRGLIAFGVGMLMTAFTLFLMPGQTIVFGILHFLGISMILFAVLKDWMDNLPCFWGLLLMLLLLAFFWSLPQGSVGLFGLFRWPLPEVLYSTRFLFPLGFPGPGFHSADYFPLLPWIFCFMAGAYLGSFFVQGEMPSALYRTHSTPLAFVGRHALVVYILHQPILYGVLYGVFWLLTRMGMGSWI